MSRKKKILLIIGIIFIWLMLSLIFTVFYIQANMLFYPWHDAESYETLKNEESFEELKIDNNGKVLSGWLKKNTMKTPAPLVILYGGNVQNSSNTCMRYLEEDRFQYLEEYNFMVVDYPEYGLSEGKASEKSIFEAALRVYDYASKLDIVDQNNIVVMGYSLGSGVATYVASQRNVNGLILLAPYDTMLSVYNSYFNVFHGPIKILARYKFESTKYAQDVNVAPLIITSYDDEVINYQFSLNLASYFKDVEEKMVLENGVKHADYLEQEIVWESINKYLNRRNIEENNENR